MIEKQEAYTSGFCVPPPFTRLPPYVARLIPTRTGSGGLLLLPPGPPAQLPSSQTMHIAFPPTSARRPLVDGSRAKLQKNLRRFVRHAVATRDVQCESGDASVPLTSPEWYALPLARRSHSRGATRHPSGRWTGRREEGHGRGIWSALVHRPRPPLLRSELIPGQRRSKMKSESESVRAPVPLASGNDGLVTDEPSVPDCSVACG